MGEPQPRSGKSRACKTTADLVPRFLPPNIPVFVLLALWLIFFVFLCPPCQRYFDQYDDFIGHYRE